MNRDELLELCDRYVRRRCGAMSAMTEAGMPPVMQIVDSYLHAEISESEKNSLLAYVRGPDDDEDSDSELALVDHASLAELDDLAD